MHRLWAKMGSVVTTRTAFAQRWAPSSRHAPALGKDGLCRHDGQRLLAKMASVVATGNVFWQRWPLSSRRAAPFGKDGLRRHDTHCLCAKMGSVGATFAVLAQNLPPSSRRAPSLNQHTRRCSNASKPNGTAKTTCASRACLPPPKRKADGCGAMRRR
jgi:hypothetical protein